MHTFIFFFILIGVPFFVEAKTYSYFFPPKNWEIATPEKDSKHVKIGFVGPSKSGFSASLNLATEDIGTISLADYIKAVKTIYERNPENRWRQLGKIKTKVGEASLIEIDTKTEYGNVRLMQMIYLQNGIAYIVTAAALKEEFGSLTRDFQKAFETFTLTDDLFALVGEKRKEIIKQNFDSVKQALVETSPENKIFQKEHWKPFEKNVLANFSDMGQYWQILLFEEVLEK